MYMCVCIYIFWDLKIIVTLDDYLQLRGSDGGNGGGDGGRESGCRGGDGGGYGCGGCDCDCCLL